MAPKIKSNAFVFPEATATQPDTLPIDDVQVPATDNAPAPETPAKGKRGRPKGKTTTKTSRKGRASVSNIIADVISSDTLLQVQVVQQVLESLEKLAAKSLMDHGIFRMGFADIKLRSKKARAATERRLFGKDR